MYAEGGLGLGWLSEHEWSVGLSGGSSSGLEVCTELHGDLVLLGVVRCVGRVMRVGCGISEPPTTLQPTVLPSPPVSCRFGLFGVEPVVPCQSTTVGTLERDGSEFRPTPPHPPTLDVLVGGVCVILHVLIGGSSFVGLMVLYRGAYPPRFGAVRTVALEILKSGSPLARMLAACCLLLARNRSQPVCLPFR